MERFAEMEQCLAQEDKLVVEENVLVFLDHVEEDKRELEENVFQLQDLNNADVDKSVLMENAKNQLHKVAQEVKSRLLDVVKLQNVVDQDMHTFVEFVARSNTTRESSWIHFDSWCLQKKRRNSCSLQKGRGQNHGKMSQG